jgi:Domain of unknown function (DUF4838)
MSHAFALCGLLTIAGGIPPGEAATRTVFETLAIVPVGEDGDTASAARLSGELLARRVREMSALTVAVGALPEPVPADSLTIVIGIPGGGGMLDELLKAARCALPTEVDPGPEGFVLRSHRVAGRQFLLAAAVDRRGCLYAVGEILRQMGFDESAIALSVDLDLRTAPAFEVRGTQFDQGHTMLQLTGARPWTEEEEQRVVLDYALAGANTFEVSERLSADSDLYRFLKAYDLKTLVHYGPNIGNGPPEWQAKEGIGRKNYLCPSVPEAREVLLKKCEARFKDSPTFDYVRFFSGDGGGCECERCKPYGNAYIHLCEALSAVIHTYHPETEIFCTNEKTDNAGDKAIWEYLREKPRPWLRAFCYGCGSDAMTWQPGRRQDHRMDLFRYPGFGPLSRYPQEIVHNLPPEQSLVYYNELTHWWYSELGYVRFPPAPDANGDVPPRVGSWIYDRHPDFYLAQVYHRRTFFAWPRYYHRVFNDLMPFAIGDVTHSSGHHDHLNQWMWQRLLWSPRTSVEDVVDSYCRTWFGPEAAPLMAEAVLQLEENLGGNAPEEEGIDRYYARVKEAGETMPTRWMKSNWLWRQYMQKGALDKHIRLGAQRQLALQNRIDQHIDEALRGDSLGAAVSQALGWFDTVFADTEEQKALREEARRLGEESDALFGVRSEGYFNLDHDFIGLGWSKKMLERAQSAPLGEKKELLKRIADYENPGEGGYYDNAGDPDGAPHMIYGTPYDHGQQLWEEALSEANRPSQRLMAFTSHEAQGVTFHYDDLDPAAEYRVRFTLVRPRFEPFCSDLMTQHSQSVYAGEILLAENLELPEFESKPFEFDIPREATKDGTLTLRMQKSPGVAEAAWVDVAIWRNNGGWGTLVSEVWLLKKPASSE